MAYWPSCSMRGGFAGVGMWPFLLWTPGARGIIPFHSSRLPRDRVYHGAREAGNACLPFTKSIDTAGSY